MTSVPNVRLITSLVAAAVVLALVVFAVCQSSGWQVAAAYSTSLSSRTNAQVHNLQLAVKSLNGKVIPPGAEFSFNRTVGSWTADRGYVKAPVSFDGELIPAWGGGVCQASSTLYNAALLSGLDICERHRHRFPARYVPPGQDAAVAQYNIDLRFRNPYKFPVKIEAEIVGERVACRILSKQPIGKRITIERSISQVTMPGEVIRSSGSSLGTHHRIINHGRPGIRVAVYRCIATAGHSIRTFISEDTYPPMNRLIKVR